MPLYIIENLDLEKPSFFPLKWPRKLKIAKNSKLPKLPETFFEPVEKGGWPPISTWINPPSGSNGIHCVEFPGEREKHFLNLYLNELFSLLEKLHYGVKTHKQHGVSTYMVVTSGHHIHPMGKHHLIPHP